MSLSVEEQITLYREGTSIREIAKRLSTPTTSVSRRFKRLGVLRRTHSEAVHLGLAHTGKPIGRPRTYIMKEDFFDTLTPESAYVIGLIQADGTIRHDRFSIAASVKDIAFLHTIAGVIGSNRPLQEVQHPLGRVARLAINSSRMAGVLRQWGIHSPRTFTASTHHDLLLNRDYWRGFIDGDGCLCTSGRGSFILRVTGSHDMCDQFLGFVRHHGQGCRIKVHPSRRTFGVTINGDEAVHIAHVLYHRAVVALPRKVAIYQAWYASLEARATC